MLGLKLKLGITNQVVTGNLNTPLTITTSQTEYEYSEGETDKIVGSFTASGGTGSYTWDVVTGDDQPNFVFVGSQLQFEDVPDYDEPGDTDFDNIYEITVRVDDGVSQATLAITVSVSNVPDDPVWGGVPVDPINMIPTTEIDINGLEIVDPDPVGGTYVITITPNYGQVMWFGSLGGLTILEGSLSTWVSSLSVSGSRANIETYFLPSLKYRPNGYEGNPEIGLYLSEDAGPVDTEIINIISAPVPLQVNVEPYTTNLLENTPLDLDLRTRFSGGSGSDNWVFDIVAVDDADDFEISGHTLSLLTTNYESPTDANENNVYLVRVECYDSVSEETVTCDMEITVLDSAEEIVTIEFSQEPCRGAFQVVTPEGNVRCDAPLDQTGLQIAFNATFGSGMTAIENVTGTSFDIRFADSFGNIGDVTLSNYGSLRYRDLGPDSRTSTWTTGSDTGTGDVTWSGVGDAIAANGVFASAGNTSVYNTFQYTSQLTCSENPPIAEIEVIDVSASVTGYAVTTGLPVNLVKWGWLLNGSISTYINTSVPFSGSNDLVPVFSGFDGGYAGVDFANIESVFENGGSLACWIVVQIPETGSYVNIDCLHLEMNYYTLAGGITYTATVVQEGGA